MPRVAQQHRDIRILPMECHQKMQPDILQITKKYNEFSEKARAAGLNNEQIAEAFEAMRSGDYAKMVTYFDTSSPVDGWAFWSRNKEGAAT